MSTSRAGRLAGKVAIVSGSGNGIGRATAILFAQEDAQVVVADINAHDGERVVEEITSEGNQASFAELDVADESSWSSVVDATVSRYGKLNVLISNAGISLGHDVEETTLDEWDQVMAVNATGVFLGMKHAIRAMKQNGELCSIVNRSSIDGQIGEPGLLAYCASKGAVTVMTKSAALAVGAKGYRIRVNSVHPGYVNTRMVDKEAADFGLTRDEYREKVGLEHPIGFIGETIDIAYLDLYLASDESRWVTGAEFTIDGGYTAK
jgi:NAD(P)-dependent dehydrogenase (short-subunit alcohol dehydrogenase family)